jgi:hypothetical protein
MSHMNEMGFDLGWYRSRLRLIRRKFLYPMLAILFIGSQLANNKQALIQTVSNILGICTLPAILLWGWKRFNFHRTYGKDYKLERIKQRSRESASKASAKKGYQIASIDKHSHKTDAKLAIKLGKAKAKSVVLPAISSMKLASDSPPLNQESNPEVTQLNLVSTKENVLPSPFIPKSGSSAECPTCSKKDQIRKYSGIIAEQTTKSTTTIRTTGRKRKYDSKSAATTENISTLASRLELPKKPSGAGENSLKVGIILCLIGIFAWPFLLGGVPCLLFSAYQAFSSKGKNDASERRDAYQTSLAKFNNSWYCGRRDIIFH